jgi:monomeric sarcosine oxidase
MVKDVYDVAVIGAGVFGVWIAYELQKAGAKVVLLDGYGPANSRASSGGESRIIRMSYGPDDLYTRSAIESLQAWKKLFNDIHPPSDYSLDRLFHETGVLLLARDNDFYSEASLATLERNHVPFSKLDRDELSRRYPQLELEPTAWGLLELESGVLMARQAVRAVVAQASNLGVMYLKEAVVPPPTSGKIESITTISNRTIRAEKFVFSCGPWLPKLFPKLLGALIHVTRQEVVFLGVPACEYRFAPPYLPVWLDFNELVYSIPDVDGRGLKIAIDAHGPDFDPDTGDRLMTKEGLTAVRNYVAKRVPILRDSPIIETRVCQYENTSNGDFLIDAHPDCQNLWLVGGGSGHGFKHGPSVGKYLAGRLSGTAIVEPRFTLKTKATERQRTVF